MTSEDKKFNDLMTDYLSGAISESNQQHLSDLILSNDEYKAQFNQMLKIHAISFVPTIESEKSSNYEKLKARIHESSVKNKSVFGLSRFKNIAAIITLIISVSVASFYIYKDISSSSATAFLYETFSPIGSQTKIILPDSSVVWLNSGSTLKYNQSFGKKVREVILHGEGYFEITKDKRRPFTVHTDSINVNVLGTIFNVRAYSEDSIVTVSLIRGSVNVSLSGSQTTGLTTLKPNEQFIFDKETKKFNTTETDASRSVSWTTGKLCFVDATLEQISKDLERKYDVKIKIASEKIKNELFSGSLDLNLSLKEVLNYIDVDKKFKIKQVGDTINISLINNNNF